MREMTDLQAGPPFCAETRDKIAEGLQRLGVVHRLKNHPQAVELLNAYIANGGCV